MRRASWLLFATSLCLALFLVIAASVNADTLFGGLGGQKGISTSNGALVTINQTTGAVTVVGTPSGVTAISGLTFTSNGNLWGSTQIGGGMPPSPTQPPPITTSDLIQLNPGTGALISSVLIATPTGAPISISDLATQPGTNTIFGLQSPNDANFTGQANLYTIATNGVATLVGNTGVFFGAIAFTPNGTLYMTSADLTGTAPMVTSCPASDQENCALDTVNPTTGSILTSVPTSDFFAALGANSAGVIWAGNGGGDIGPPCSGPFCASISTLNPTTGAATFIGDTGTDFVGDLAFQPAPEPATLALLGIGLAAVVTRRCRGARKREAS